MKAYLIDFENVKSKGLTGIEQLSADDKVIIFYSENSDTISFEMHRKVMDSGADIEYLKVRVGGKNALDFQLSTLLGYLLAKELYTHIFIISGDKGFDKLHDFWNVSFADKNSVIVFRTQTLAAAVTFAKAYRSKVPAAAAEVFEPEEEEPELPAETAPAEPAEEAEVEEKPAAVPVEVKVTKSPRRRGRKPQSAEEMIKNALLGTFDLSDTEISQILACASGAEDKEDFHNALAKIFKAQATDLYKVLRPKYLRIKEALDEPEAESPAARTTEIFELGADIIEVSPVRNSPAAKEEPEAEPAEEEPAAETPAEEPEEPAAPAEEMPVEEKPSEETPAEEASAEAAAEAPAEAPAEEAAAEPVKKPRKRTSRSKTPKAKKTKLTKQLEKLLADECTAEEIAAVSRIFEETDSKQKLYLSIVKEYRKDRGCEIYKLIKSDYAALSKLKENI